MLCIRMNEEVGVCGTEVTRVLEDYLLYLQQWYEPGGTPFVTTKIPLDPFYRLNSSLAEDRNCVSTPNKPIQSSTRRIP